MIPLGSLSVQMEPFSRRGTRILSHRLSLVRRGVASGTVFGSTPSLIHAVPRNENFHAENRSILWVAQLMKDLAPEFEIFSLPKHSTHCLLVRPRVHNQVPTKGTWASLRVMSVRSRTVYGFRGVNRYPDIPTLCVSEMLNRLYMLQPGESRESSLSFGKFLSLSYDVSERSASLSRDLQEICVNNTFLRKGPLSELLISSNANEKDRRYRELLVQAMRLPVLSEFRFPLDYRAAWNGILRDKTILFRVLPLSKRTGASVPLFRISVSEDGRRVCKSYKQTDGIDIFVFLLSHPDRPLELMRVGVFPFGVLQDRGVVASSDCAGVAGAYIRRSGTLAGTALHGLDRYFIDAHAPREEIEFALEAILR